MRYFCIKCGSKKSSNYQCNSCKARQLQLWRIDNPEQNRSKKARHYRSIRDKARSRLGGKCTCCGESQPTMLNIDHVYNDGHLENKNTRSRAVIKQVLRLANPHERFQLLCANCNQSKQLNGGTCAHAIIPVDSQIGWCA